MSASRGRGPASERPRTKLRYSRLPLLTGSDLSPRRLPMMEARSGVPGDTVWITGCAHGDEVGGMVVIQEVFRALRKTPLLRGRLCAFPLLNPFGFESGTRGIPATREDLNRAFPGDSGGTLAQRIANLIFARILETRASLVLDLHNDWIQSVPYALLDPPPASDAGREAHARARDLARATHLLLVDEPGDARTRALLRSTLSGSLLEAGVPALTLELGQAHFVHEENVAVGVRSIWAVLAALGLVETAAVGPPLETAPSEYRGRRLRYSQTPYPSSSGIARFRVQPGEVVVRGQPLATVDNVFGRRQEVLRAPGDAIVLGHADSSLAVPGVPLVAMGLRRVAKAESRALPR